MICQAISTEAYQCLEAVTLALDLDYKSQTGSIRWFDVSVQTVNPVKNQMVKLRKSDI